jgi:transglutaminase-like putative cysteine protease
MTGTRDRFTISLYLTVALASAMLWGAEGTFSPAALTIPVAAAAFVYVERRGTALSTLAANGLGLAAIGAALVELWLRDVEGRILFGAHLLIYLTWILLWGPKVSRQRWGLLALAVLQVAVGSVLTNSGLYGVGMAAFLTLGVWTLVLLQLDEAETRHAPAAVPLPIGGAERPAALLLGRGDVAPAGQAAFGRWPLRQLAAAVVVTVSGAAAVGAAFFFFVPRFEVSRRSFDEADSPLARQRMTGFTERVKLGAFGEILESSVPVFEVRLYDSDGDSVDVEEYARSLGYEEPLFRGLALNRYENGEWASTGRSDMDRLPRRPGTRRYVRQEYRIRPSGTETLFGIAPYLGGSLVGTDEEIRFRWDTQAISRPRDRRFRGELNYVLFSPSSASVAEFGTGGGPGDPDELVLPRELKTRLRAISSGIARPGGAEATPEMKAERLAAYLRDSGTFRYSLSGEVINPRLDPVEDFLVNRKAGHCEYFASALALLLRAEGIPSRMVSGFKGGEVNRLSGEFEVQQRHAHTWVEADLGGRWVTLDPTPAAPRNQSVAENAPALPLWSDLRTAASLFWREYVVQMNLSQQRKAMAPLRDALLAAAKAAREGWWPALKSQAHALATDPSRWFSWQGGVVTFTALLTGVGLWRLVQPMRRRYQRWRSGQEARRRRGRRVEFYERFRRACARRGWEPQRGQTPREFAAAVSGRLAGDVLPSGVATLPRELTEEFYGVRFGEVELPEAREADLEARLGEFEAALADGNGRRA